MSVGELLGLRQEVLRLALELRRMIPLIRPRYQNGIVAVVPSSLAPSRTSPGAQAEAPAPTTPQLSLGERFRGAPSPPQGMSAPFFVASSAFFRLSSEISGERDPELLGEAPGRLDGPGDVVDLGVDIHDVAVKPTPETEDVLLIKVHGGLVFRRGPRMATLRPWPSSGDHALERNLFSKEVEDVHTTGSGSHPGQTDLLNATEFFGYPSPRPRVPPRAARCVSRAAGPSAPARFLEDHD